MGKFGLSVDFNNLSGKEHPIMNIYHIAHRRMGPLAAAPWIKHLLMGIPFIEQMKYYRIFFSWTREELNKNIEVRIPFPLHQWFQVFYWPVPLSACEGRCTPILLPATHQLSC